MKIAFEDSPYRLSRKGILESWPVDYDKASKPTLIRWLERALKEA